MSALETVPAEFEVVDLELVHRGRLIALASVVLNVAGVEMMFSGLQVRGELDRALSVEMPAYRHPASGRWMPAVRIPAELGQAIADQVLDMVAEARSTPARLP